MVTLRFLVESWQGKCEKYFLMKISYLHEHGAALAVLVYVGLVALVGDGEGGLVDGLVALLAGVGLVLVLRLAVLQSGVDLERSVLVLQSLRLNQQIILISSKLN